MCQPTRLDKKSTLSSHNEYKFTNLWFEENIDRLLSISCVLETLWETSENLNVSTKSCRLRSVSWSSFRVFVFPSGALRHGKRGVHERGFQRDWDADDQRTGDRHEVHHLWPVHRGGQKPPQNKPLFNQNKGHLGSRYIYILYRDYFISHENQGSRH